VFAPGAAYALPDLSASTTSVDFGSVPLGGTATRTVTFSNTTSSTITNVQMAGGGLSTQTGDFGNSQSCQGRTLTPGQSCAVFYEFAPKALGARITPNTFTLNGAPKTITLTGSGVDTKRPVITGSRLPAPNGAGWNNTAVVVSFACTDPGGSGVSSLTAPITIEADGAGQTATGTCTDNAGNSASATVGGIDVDRTAPIVTYSGNAGTYSIDQVVSITCAALDALSGVVSSTCAGVNASAMSLGLGPHTLSATATDRAGNTGAGSTTFTVVATPEALCRLTRQLVRSSVRYQTGSRADRAVAEGLTTSACIMLHVFSEQRSERRERVRAYKLLVSTLESRTYLSATQAATLKSYADMLR